MIWKLLEFKNIFNNKDLFQFRLIFFKTKGEILVIFLLGGLQNWFGVGHPSKHSLSFSIAKNKISKKIYGFKKDGPKLE